MANILPVVTWALERGCALRTGLEPRAVVEQLWPLQMTGPVFEDTIIVEECAFQDQDGTPHQVPVEGFRLEGRLLEPGQDLCSGCTANIGLKAAGCYGTLNQDLSLADWPTLEKLGLAELYRTEFSVTDPPWYGLWLDSPLQPGQRELLGRLFAEVPNSERFREALLTPLPLHVSLQPPAHSDFGVATTLAHCGRCKALPGPEWDGDSAWDCQVCGHTDLPARNVSQECDDSPFLFLAQDLEDYGGFVKRWLESRGVGEQSQSYIVARVPDLESLDLSGRTTLSPGDESRQ